MEKKHTINKPLKLSGVKGELVSKEIADELLEIVIEYDKHLDGLSVQRRLSIEGEIFHNKIKALIKKATE